ncbi:MAG: hypothetical protein UZ11_BCD004000274 [Bacteroidetes bacterium OLB11]|nr:MAG: hypothetical protein UZ11_BCD004000274 [Bacteroidetes bacterium OLB11]
MSQYPYVPYGATVHGEEEIEAVVHVLRTTTQMGKHVRELEQKVANLYHKKIWDWCQLWLQCLVSRN